MDSLKIFSEIFAETVFICEKSESLYNLSTKKSRFLQRDSQNKRGIKGRNNGLRYCS